MIILSLRHERLSRRNAGTGFIDALRLPAYRQAGLPAGRCDWLPEDHLARFIVDITDKLDFIAILNRNLFDHSPSHTDIIISLFLHETVNTI